MNSGALATLGLSLAPAAAVFAEQRLPQNAASHFQFPDHSERKRRSYFTKGAFDPHLKTVFRAQSGRAVINLRLVRVEDLTPPAATGVAAGDSWCFTLVFEASRRLSNLQTIFPMEHPALGKFPLFLVENEPIRGRFHYTATINNLHP